MKYNLTEEDIKELTKPSLWRDWMNDNKNLSFEEYKIWWDKKHENITRNYS